MYFIGIKWDSVLFYTKRIVKMATAFIAVYISNRFVFWASCILFVDENEQTQSYVKMFEVKVPMLREKHLPGTSKNNLTTLVSYSKIVSLDSNKK